MKRWFVIAAACLMLLLVGGLYFAYGASRFEVTVANDLGRPIDRIVFSDPLGNFHAVPTISAGQRVTHKFRFKGEGGVKYRLEAEGSIRSGTLIGYITGGMGEKLTMTIDASGIVTVRDKSGTVVGWSDP